LATQTIKRKRTNERKGTAKMKFPTNCEIERVVSKDATRPQLNHVYFDVEKKRLCATNGSVLAVVPVTHEHGDDGGMISADAVKAARKACRKDNETWLHPNGEVSIKGGMRFPRPAVPDGVSFPPIDPILNTMSGVGRGEPGTVTVCLDVALLAELAKAIGRGGEKFQGVALTFRVKVETDAPDADRRTYSVPHDPIRVETGRDDGACGLLMPCRL